MIEEIKKSESCKECRRIIHHKTIKVTCDYCIKDITEESRNSKSDFCRMTLFQKYSDDTNVFHFCNWNCFLDYFSIAKLPSFDFIDLPFLKEDQLETLQNRIKDKQT